jgi:zinc transport system substrate-binding protein
MLRAFTSLICFFTLIASAKAEPKVVVSIKPVHSIVTSVMKGVGEPSLLIDGSTSPHNFTLKPSQAKSLQEANVIIWVSHNLETFLERSLENVSPKTKVLEISDIKNLVTHEFREHDDHDGHKDEAKHDDHDDHGDHKHEAKHDDHDDHGDHKHEAKHDDHDDHAGHEGHNHEAGGVDPHLWLDTQNMIVIAEEVTNTLVETDPANADKYKANSKALKAKLTDLNGQLEAIVKTSKGKPYVVFHDAYQYFEKQYGLKAPTPITINPETPPGAARIKEIKHEVEEQSITCLFSEPQFSPKVLDVIAENTGAKISSIDPLGSTIAKGEDHYFQSMLNLANTINDCLGAKS